eukprot:gnl/TRDRNA2_/TRDRNA2_63296_c0_seq1.p1 gnl/TRDRNA2_/TRDRNA2_63296_c0~~gnl/TRDRNA2_/TRDRNA2_63296_c0_seq1.p1  ORF type:complete len:258 (-),score=25.03 gnl/TRDRNA2_/TRDRNA2_63296_c0_seq1:62-778(-)
MSPTPESLHKPALVAGVGIVLLCLVGGYAGMHIETVVKKDVADQDSFTLRATLLSFFVSGCIDLVVAYALFVFFRPLHLHISLVAAGFRVVYVTVLLGNLPTLNMLCNMLDTAGERNKLQEAQEAIIRSGLQQTNLSFNGTALALFGIHLFLLGVMIVGGKFSNQSSSYQVPLWLGIALLVAGFGYTADSVDRMLFAEPTLQLTAHGCFIGEVLLMVWLLVAGRKMVVDADPGAALLE